MPGHYAFSLLTEKNLAKKDSAVHSGLKPYIPFFSEKYRHVKDSHQVFRFIKNDPLLDLIFRKHFLQIEPREGNFVLHVDPLINLEAGRDLNDSLSSNLFTNSRGVIARGTIGEKFYFETMFSENQSVFPAYLATNVTATGVVPGQGRWKNFKTNGFDYAFSSGFVSIQALPGLNLQLGHGKQKVGHGYRSLLLSDNAFNYPFARVTQQWFKGRVQYSNIYAVLMNLVPASVKQNPFSERLFQKKAAAFQYLSINITKSLNLGLFQGLVWQAADEKNRQHLSWQYFNPLIYSNLFTYGLDHRNNVMTGGDILLKLTRTVNLYGQLMLDGLRNDSVRSPSGGIQGGIRYFDVLGVRNLFLQVEYNHVENRPYLSPPGTISDQSFAHYGQVMGFTRSGGRELLLVADYRIRRTYVNLRYHVQRPANIPAFSKVDLLNLQVGYVINTAYNLNIMAGILYRTENFSNFIAANRTTNYIYAGIRTSIYNLYYDF